MFDDLETKENKTNVNAGDDKKLDKSVEQPKSDSIHDMFSETDNVVPNKKEKPNIFQPKQNDQKPGKVSPPVDLMEESSGNVKKIILVVVVAIVLGAVIFGGFWAVNYFLTKNTNKATVNQIDKQVDNSDSQDSNNSQDSNVSEDNSDQQVNEEPKVNSIDSDGDGLSDEKELELGTKLSSPDSDDDGLFDKDEVEIYKTNPLDADTDKDGILDGEEVKAGQNPNGDGRLYELPGQVDDISNVQESDVDNVVKKTDSDNDGLSDDEELNIYGTDPNNPDTDVDGYTDGEEVKNGYNPNGAGKLQQ